MSRGAWKSTGPAPATGSGGRIPRRTPAREARDVLARLAAARRDRERLVARLLRRDTGGDG